MSAPSRLAASAVLVASLLVALPAWASPSSRLVYVRADGAEACPAEADLRHAVAERLGYDPFFPSAPKTVIAEISRAGNTYRGTVQIVGSDGIMSGRRDLGSSGDDCRELLSSMALAISIALDDLDEAPSAPPPPPPPPTPPPAPPPAAEVPKDDAPRAPPPTVTETPWDLSASVGPTLSFGTAPDAALGAGLGAMLGKARAALRLDVRAELPATTSFAGGGSVSTNIFFTELTGCFRPSIGFVCLGGGAGVIWSRTTGIAQPHGDNGGLLGPVLRLGTDFSLSARFNVEPFLLGGMNLARPSVAVDGNPVYTVSLFTATAGISVGTSIF